MTIQEEKNHCSFVGSFPVSTVFLSRTVHTSIFQHSLFGDVSQPFLSHETSHLKLSPKPFALLPGDPFFCPSIVHPLAFLQEPSPLQGLRFVLTSSHILSCPFSPASIHSSICVPVFAAHNPNTFCTISMFLLYGALSLPCRALPNVICPIFPPYVWCLHAAFFGPSHFPCILMFLLLLPHLIHRDLFAVAHHLARCFLLPHVHPQMFTFLLASAQLLHDPSILPPNRKN